MPNRTPDSDIMRVLQLINDEDYTFENAAEEVGVSIPTVRRIVKGQLQVIDKGNRSFSTELCEYIKENKEWITTVIIGAATIIAA